MKSLESLHLPALPELTSGYLVIQKDAWELLTRYINAQTSTINALIDSVKSLSKLHDKQALNTDTKVSTLASEVAEIAQALEGAYVDE